MESDSGRINWFDWVWELSWVLGPFKAQFQNYPGVCEAHGQSRNCWFDLVWELIWVLSALIRSLISVIQIKFDWKHSKLIGLIGSVNWLGVFTRPFWRAISTSVEFSVAFPVDCEARYNHRIRKGWVLRMLWGIFFNFYKFGELMRTFIASNYCQGKLLRKKKLNSISFRTSFPYFSDFQLEF